MELSTHATIVEDREVEIWDPQPYTSDSSGRRLFEEVGRRCARAAAADGDDFIGVAISMPGTLKDSRQITTSSRLNVRNSIDVAEVVYDQCDLPARVFHDMPSMAAGYATAAPSSPETFAYVALDEGVGSVLVLDGRAHRGAGVAGSLGRMVVEPDGVYSTQITARGTLETYVGRPWISENCVALWEAEQDKQGGRIMDEHGLFRRSLKTAATTGSRQALTCQQLSAGYAAHDPIAIHAMSTAARYAGYGINCLLAIVHPHRLVLGGRLCTEVPGFADEVERFTRLYSWPNSWNAVQFLHSADSRKDQRLGAALALLDEIGP